jgi:hypothetical protein
VSVPQVYAAITAVTAALSKFGIQKTRTNAQEQYQFRGIDDVYDHLSPLLAEHRLCILPRTLDRERVERRGVDGKLLFGVCVRVAYDLVSAQDGSCHTLETYGEALDGGDKATSKAMSAAFKSAILQTFCVPVSGREEPDFETHKVQATTVTPEPPGGWEQWSCDIMEIARVCETDEALDRLQSGHRKQLKAVSLERRDLYDQIGEAVLARRAAIRRSPAKMKSRENGTPLKAAAGAEREQANA